MHCKVITTCFTGHHDQRDHFNNELKYPDHYQNNSSPEDVLKMIKDVVAFELEQDPGVDMDLIIVNNDVGYAPGNEYLKFLAGTKLKRGLIHTLKRENIGWSFGGFSHAFEVFRDKYKYWLFTEDDILIGGEDYYKKVLDKFLEKPDTGFVALVQVCHHTSGIHAGGGVGLTSREILNKVWQKEGRLPHYTESLERFPTLLIGRHQIITHGEIHFTNVIWGMGYQLVDYTKATSWNLEKNLAIPYYNYVYQHHHPKLLR